MGFFSSKKSIQSSPEGIKAVFEHAVNMMYDVVDSFVIDDEDWEYEDGIRTRAYSFCSKTTYKTYTDGITWYIGSGPHCYINKDDEGYFWYAGKKYSMKRYALMASMFNFCPRTSHPRYGTIDFYSMFVNEYSIK